MVANNLSGVLDMYKRFPTNSAEWLIQESEKKKEQRKKESAQEHDNRRELMKNNWERKKAEYNEARKKKREEARKLLVKETGNVPNLTGRIGRPNAPVPPADTSLSALQGQAQVIDIVSEHVDYTEIDIPKELGPVFHDTSEHPVIVLSPDQGTWPLYHISPFSLIAAKTRIQYINSFKTAMEAAGYTSPDNPHKDPMIYSDWYAKNWY